MYQYHKIKTVFKRDPKTKHKTLLEGEYSTPEFAYLANNSWVFTEKVDGTNIRVMFDGATITFGGKTERAQIPATLVTALNAQFLPQITKFIEIFGEAEVCLYGEGYGAKIQKGGGRYRLDQGFVLFDVWVEGWWLKRQDVEDVADKLRIKIVPIVDWGSLTDLVEYVRPGFQSAWGDFQAEGVVARPATELQTRSGHRIITKLKCRDFIPEEK